MTSITKGIAIETIIKIGAAVAAAYIIGQVPPLKKWIQAQWGNGA